MPGAPPNPAATRQITTVEPVKGAMNADTLCGPTRNHNTQFAAQSIRANPGSTIEFDWRGGDMSFWPHSTGPMLTYMANCGDGGCETFDATKARWFKIQQIGRKTSGDRAWAQVDLMSGTTAIVTIPPNIAPGNYLIRHEIIALHLATRRGGAEFYPSCTQLIIGGNGTGRPSNEELVSFPGGYSDDDPGIFFPGTFDVNARYTFPGPQIAAFVSDPAPSNDGGNGNSNNSSNSPSSPTSSSTPSPSQSSSAGNQDPNSPSTSGGISSSNSVYNSQCHLKRRAIVANGSSSTSNLIVARSRPSHTSRIMQKLRAWGIGNGVNFNANGAKKSLVRKRNQ
ncbi:hypothetical protein ONZ45_g12864 [Pleurotus djamor]|nr:hypothetical protein ONZ45_g12864 [Pleurotus djamor]